MNFIHGKLFTWFKNKRAMSSAIATLMTLTAAVVLSATVVLFATNVTAGEMSSKENVIIPTTHIWYINDTNSVGAIGLTNTGSTDIIINKITVKGIKCEWNEGNNSFVLYYKMTGAIQGDLPFVDVVAPQSNVTIADQPCTLDVASQGLSVKAGTSMICYIALPGNIMIYDMGQSIHVSVLTTQAIYTVEASVEAPS
jgi:hypothetical protein